MTQERAESKILDLSGLRRLAGAALPESDVLQGRMAMTATPEAQGLAARIWYDDGDRAATVDGNLGLDIDATALAEFWAAANPSAVLALLDRIDALEAALKES